MDTIQALYAEQVEGPKYRQVAQAIRLAVSQGDLKPADKLPTVRDLAWHLKITPGTVARAYTLLTDDGTAYAEVGRGTFVAEPQGRAPHRDDDRDRRWSRHLEPENTDSVSLFSPKLPDLGQVALIHESFARMADRPAKDFMTYPGRSTSELAQRAGMRWLSGIDLGPIAEKDIVLSHGSQSGLMLVMQAVLKGARPVILVEELSYPGFRRAAQLLRAEVIPVPMDEQGIVPQELERLARQHDAQMLCTCPEVHNPTGITTPNARRQEIAEVALRMRLHIVQDESYRLSQANGLSYRALVPDFGWYLTSISKSLTPSLRVGFVVAPKAHRAGLRRAAEHGFFGLAQPLIFAVEDIFGRPDIHDLMDKVQAEMRIYIHAAVNALGGYNISWHPDVPYIWLNLPEGWRAAAFAQAAEAQGAQVRTSEDFVPRDGFAPHAVRLAINAEVSLASFERALMRLRTLLDNPPEAFMG